MTYKINVYCGGKWDVAYESSNRENAYVILNLLLKQYGQDLVWWDFPN